MSRRGKITKRRPVKIGGSVQSVKSKTSYKIYQKPLHCAGVFGIIIRRLRMPCIFAGQRYALTREVATIFVGYFRRVCPISEPGEKNTDGKGIWPPRGPNFHELCVMCCPGELRCAVHRLSSCKSVKHPERCSVFIEPPGQNFKEAISWQSRRKSGFV